MGFRKEIYFGVSELPHVFPFGRMLIGISFYIDVKDNEECKDYTTKTKKE